MQQSPATHIYVPMFPNCSGSGNNVRSTTEHIMSKSQDAKKTEKKVAVKSPKEKKEAKKVKKEASKRQ
ncbi:hypothetical protein SBC1_18570 [Caballeronia sp. SBC1]|jgi:hypothetical protein|nr:hypothetical protein SBC2_19950 [Caballeronia sp. SBC2]QIN61862.1 hypothetical protein SBC1_18570 [Caballeronia sp. SBC1]